MHSTGNGGPEATKPRRGSSIVAARAASFALRTHCSVVMQVVSKSDGVLTNFEVADLLARQQQQRLDEENALPLPGARRGQSGSTAWSSQQTLAGVSEQVVGYLEKSPCAGQVRENIVAFQQSATQFNLTQMETLALVNTPPCSVVEVHLLVEECEERLKPGDVKELLKLIRHYLVPVVEAAPEEEGNDGGEQPVEGDDGQDEMMDDETGGRE